jgi:hypothetical protein
MTNAVQDFAEWDCVPVITPENYTNNWLAIYNKVNEPHDYVEISGSVVTQAFTAAAGYEVVVGLTERVNNGAISSTSTNVTIGTTGDYRVTLTASFDTSVANMFLHGHLFTNGVHVPRIGWSRSMGTANDQGSAAGSGLIRLTAGQIIDLRADVDKDATMIFDHISIILEQLKD